MTVIHRLSLDAACSLASITTPEPMVLADQVVCALAHTAAMTRRAPQSTPADCSVDSLPPPMAPKTALPMAPPLMPPRRSLSVAGAGWRVARVASARICAVTPAANNPASPARATGARQTFRRATSTTGIVMAKCPSRRRQTPTRQISRMIGVMGAAMAGTMAGVGGMAAHDARAGMTRSSMATGMASGRLARGIPPGQRMTSRWSRIHRVADVVVAVVAARSQPCATTAAP